MDKLKIELGKDVRGYSDSNLLEVYNYYYERKDRLGEMEKLYLTCLTVEVDKRSKVCPSCKNKYLGYPALSRKDNKTEICPECGQKEALSEWIAYKMEEQNGK